MTEEQKKKFMGLGIALVAVYAAYRFAPNQTIKAMALGVGGVMVAKQVPYIKEAV